MRNVTESDILEELMEMNDASVIIIYNSAQPDSVRISNLMENSKIQLEKLIME